MQRTLQSFADAHDSEWKNYQSCEDDTAERACGRGAGAGLGSPPVDIKRTTLPEGNAKDALERNGNNLAISLLLQRETNRK